MIPRPWLAAVLVALLAAFILGWGLGRCALYEPDEARHAEIAREMVESSSGWRGWVTPHHNFAPYRNKPAPFYWLIAGSYAAFGVGEASARLVSVVAGILTAVVVAAWGASRWGPRTGLLAGLVLVTAPEFVLLGRFATLDMTMTLWITLGVLAVHRFAERPGSSLVPAAIAGAAGLLSKGLVAPGLIALVGLADLTFRRRLGLLTPRTLMTAGAVFLAITVPWHLMVAAVDPSYLYQLYIAQQWDRAVAAEGRGLHARSVLFYVPVLLGGFFPWSALLPASVRGTLWPEGRDHSTVFCALWAATVLVVFSLASGKLGYYILPAFTPLALLTARFLRLVLAGVTTPTEARLLRAGVWAVVGVLLLAPAAAIGGAAMTYGGALLGPSLWSLVLLPPAVVIILLVRRERLRAAVLAVACTAAGFVLAFYQLVAPAFMEVRSDAPVARALLAAAPDHADVPLVGYHVRSASLPFHLRRPVLLRDRPKQLESLLARHGRLFVVTSPRHRAELEAAGPYVLLFAGPRRLLYGARAPSAPPDAGP